jgi:PAS domain-containing protein
MIIRLLRGQVPAGRESTIVERLRALDTAGSKGPGFVGATFGFRRANDGLGFLVLSTWESVDAISAATAGPPDVELPSQPAGDALEGVTIDLFEVADGPPFPVDAVAGGALGIVWARVAPHAEAAAHDMIRAVGPEVGAAGVAGLHVGRRVIRDQTELLVVASWRDRVALHEIAQGRANGTLDPAFLRLMTDWRFETYDCLASGSSLLPSPGPAVFLADSRGHFVDASVGIESLLGVPAELVLRRTLPDLTPPERRPDAERRWAACLAAGEDSGTFEILRPNGRPLEVAFRAEADCPRAGIHALVLSSVAAAPDPRPVREIVAEAIPDTVAIAV